MKKEYYSNPRKEICFFLNKKDCYNILDVGCGVGSTTEFIKRSYNVEFSVGVDLYGHENQGKVFDEFYNVDLNNLDVLSLLEKHNPNVILLLDVLEHLKDPYDFLKQLSHYNGNMKIIFSVPNVSHYTVFTPYLFKGTWDYKDSGVLDRTHLHFFGKKNIEKLLENNGLNITNLVPQYKLFPNSKSLFFHNISFGVLERFIALQYLGVANKMVTSYE